MRRRLSDRVLVAATVLVALALSFFAYVHSEKLIDSANERRYRTVQLADQLRHSSDDLTRMVRTYVVTGNPAYKRAFQSILDIRDGKLRAPDDYDGAFWDLALVGGREPVFEPGPVPSLLDQVRDSGVTPEELALLAEAKAKSDGLTAREFAAMALAESPDGDSRANRARAVAMLHDDLYHEAKAAIMRPINAFYASTDRRTLAAVQDAVRTAVVLRLVFIAFTVGAVLLLWKAHRELRATLGGPADEVHAQIIRIGQGDLSAPARLTPQSPGSVLARLADMRAKLHAIESARQAASAELADKNEALARSNAELEAFAYVASHDLREPLRNVTAFSTLLARQLEGRLNGEEQELLKILCDAAARMDSLVRDLLEVSRVGRGELDLRPVAIADVVAAALASLRIQMEAASASVEVADTLPVVMGNADELYRVFLNVLGNCLKYRGERAPAIRIAASREGASAWCLRVTDNGIGIEAGYGYEERIFGLFQRLHQRDQHGGGTGIGLTVCRKIVNRHGGRIWAESEGLGKGLTIAFTLPAVRG